MVEGRVTFQVCFTCRDGSGPKASEQASHKYIKVTERSPVCVAVALIYMLDFALPLPWLGLGLALALPLLGLGFALAVSWLGLGLALAVPWLGFGFALALHLLCLGFALALPLHLLCACTMKTRTAVAQSSDELTKNDQWQSARNINLNSVSKHLDSHCVRQCETKSSKQNCTGTVGRLLCIYIYIYIS